MRSARFRFFVAIAIAAVAAGLGACSGSQTPPSILPPETATSAARPHSVDAYIWLEAPSNVEQKPVKAIEFELKDFSFTRKAVNLAPGGTCIRTPADALKCKEQLKLIPRSRYLIDVKTFNKPFPPGSTKPPPGAKMLSESVVPAPPVVNGKWKLYLDIYFTYDGTFVTGESADVAGNQQTGFTLSGAAAAGKSPALFGIVGLDAAGHDLIGPGSPTFKIRSSNSTVRVAVDGNAFTLALPKSANPVSTTLTATVNVCTSCVPLHFQVATQPATPSPSPSPSPTPTSSPAAVFVTYSTSLTAGTVVAYDEQGNVIPLSGNWTGAGEPFSIVWDPHIAWFYLTAANTGTGNQTTVQVYTGAGDHLSSFTFAETAAAALAYDSHLNEIFVAGNVATNQNTIHVYGEDGGAPLSSGFPQTIMPSFGGLSFDAHLNELFVGNLQTGNVEVYNEHGGPVSLAPGAFTRPSACVSCPPFSLVVDPANANDVYVVWGNGPTHAVAAYNESGAQIPLSGAFPGLTNPQAIVADTHNGLLYITDGTTVKAFDAQGNPQTLGGTFTPPFTPLTANGIAILPPP